MSEHDLTPTTLKATFHDEVAQTSTFQTHGISADAARKYLNTPEGAVYLQRLTEAAPIGTTPTAIADRAIGQLTSGRDLPRMVTIGPDEPLVKAVPMGQAVNPHSPYFGRQPEFENTLARGYAINDHFGLPIKNEAPVYDLVEIHALQPTEVFVSTVARTSELGGQVTHAGGATQYLIPDRNLFTVPVRITNIGNDLALHNDLVVGKGLGAPLIPESGTVARGVGPTLARGAGVLGDATTTAGHVNDLRRNGNQVGAASQVEHFAGRNLGGLGGAVMGAEFAGLAGSESGPFDLLVAGVGAIGGAVAGDKLVDVYDRRRIYHQTDPQGRTWHLDPHNQQAGWTRELPPLPDTPHGQRFTADPALANRLTYQANTTAAELALSHTGRPTNPWTQPANAQDTQSFGNPPWQRDARTGQWQRKIAYPFVERQPVRPPHLETASPQRSAELNAAAERTMADNIATSPRGIAERYQALYAEHDWQPYGPMSEAVARALQTPAHTLEASDGHTYTRGRDGEWTTPGRFWGSNVATGNLRAELAVTDMLREAAAKARTPRAVEPTTQRHAAVPAAPAATREASKIDALPERTRARDAAAALPSERNDLRHPGHPQHALYATFRQLLPEGTSEARLAQATAASHAAGMHKPEDVANIYSGAHGKVLITTNSLFAQVAEMDISRPPPTVQQSLQAIEQHDQQQQQMRLQAQQEIAQPAARSAAMHR